jgi:MFS family permease
LTTAEPNPPGADGALPPTDYRWNAGALMVDMASFSVGMSFVSSTTVLPSLIAALGGSEVIVGLGSGLISGAWLLPQLLIAGIVARLPRKKPFMARTAWLTRPILLVLALIILLLGQTQPVIVLAAVLVSTSLFFMFDAMVSVPWFDLIARAIPPTRRGRLLGGAQVLGGIGGILAGVAVRAILREGSAPTFPADYALLYACATVMMLISAGALSMVREPASDAPTRDVPPLRQVLAQLPGIIAHDRSFRRVVGVRVLAGFVGMASAFYVLNATRNAGLSLEAAGLFVSAQVAGSLAGGLLTGALQDRWGPLVHLRTIIGVSALPPAIALVCQPFLAALGPSVLYPYLLLYFALGIYIGSIGWPYFNWILEYAEEAKRPLYIGMANTLGAITMITPALGGWVARDVSYTAVFALSLAFALTGLALSRYIPSTRWRE